MLYLEQVSKKKRHRALSPFYQLRQNVYQQRVDNNVTKQFKQVHNVKRNDPELDTITEADGLQRAYDLGDVYVHGDDLFVAGSHTGQDWWDDFTKIPFYCDLRNADRYKAAEKVLKENPNIKRIIGHSLGGSVALELQKNFPERDLKTRTYGAPVWEPFPTPEKQSYDLMKATGTQEIKIPFSDMVLKQPEKIERYRNVGDPFSFFDSGATNYFNYNPLSSKSLTHDYRNIAKDFTSTAPKENRYDGWVWPKDDFTPSTEPMQPMKLDYDDSKPWISGDQQQQPTVLTE